MLLQCAYFSLSYSEDWNPMPALFVLRAPEKFCRVLTGQKVEIVTPVLKAYDERI